MVSEPVSTHLSLTDLLPLTCTRTGTCCHGKAVWINPWELACLAEAKGVSPRIFRDRFCECGGIRLRFDGKPGWKELAACCMYRPGTGCNVHAGRPLACRLYPLGREKRSGKAGYIHRGRQFPCLDGCPEVEKLPCLTVADYLAGQQVQSGEAAQDAYLELMQELADGAFALLLDSGLAASGDRQTLRHWRTLGSLSPEDLAEQIGTEWIDHLVLPGIDGGTNDCGAFIKKHHALLQQCAQERFGALPDADAVRDASVIMMGLALHLGCSLGAAPAELIAQWVQTAKEHGAMD